jgi:nucleotide-binding universal stress UspA family protein
MTILFAYDGSENADAAIAGSASLLGGRENAEAVVLTVWEPLVVEAVRTMRFGGSVPPIPTNVAEVDDSAEEQAKQLAEHGARLAGEAGFDARALWVADDRRIADAIVAGAEELDADVIVTGTRGLAGIAALLGSVSSHVVQNAKRPVLVVPRDGNA